MFYSESKMNKGLFKPVNSTITITSQTWEDLSCFLIIFGKIAVN